VVSIGTVNGDVSARPPTGKEANRYINDTDGDGRLFFDFCFNSPSGLSGPNEVEVDTCNGILNDRDVVVGIVGIGEVADDRIEDTVVVADDRVATDDAIVAAIL
jgi:hypothetical protein